MHIFVHVTHLRLIQGMLPIFKKLCAHVELLLLFAKGGEIYMTYINVNEFFSTQSMNVKGTIHST